MKRGYLVWLTPPVLLVTGFVCWQRMSRAPKAATPAARPTARGRARTRRSAPGPVTTKEADFLSGGVRLRGTLYMPGRSGPYPGIVLAHGRTELGRRHPLFVVMAEGLAEKGYLVLTFDFRGFGQSEAPHEVHTPNDLDFRTDVSQALTFLLETRLVNPRRMFLVGHSFGGGVVLAAGLADSRVNKVVSLSPPRRCYELYFGEHPTNRSDLQRMMAQCMHLPRSVPMELLYPVLSQLIPDILLNHPQHPPVLFIQGGLEDGRDLAFLKGVFDRMTDPKGYEVVDEAQHYFGVQRDATAASAATAVYRPKIMKELIDLINNWFRGGQGSPAEEMSGGIDGFRHDPRAARYGR